MKEKSKFLGMVNWTVSTDRLGAVEIATAEACSVGSFVHSNLLSNDASGLTSFDILEATRTSYVRFCLVLERENKRLCVLKLDDAAARHRNPNQSAQLSVVPTLHIEVVSVKALRKLGVLD